MKKFDIYGRLALAWLGLLLAAACLAPWLVQNPFALDLNTPLAPPSWQHWAGTDALGRDMLARAIHAARATLFIVAFASAIDMAVATVLAVTAAYLGGWVDRSLQLMLDVLWTLPFVIAVVVIVSVLGSTMTTLILSIAAVNWVTAARIIRADARSLFTQPFVRAGSAFGFRGLNLVTEHILPPLKPTLLSVSAYTAIEILSLESGLAFIGLSLPAPAPTWGGLLSEGMAYFESAWWLATIPAAGIIFSLLALQLIARQWETKQRTNLTP